jgi:LAS superfamily LD-carboxypeptidase LdcB
MKLPTKKPTKPTTLAKQKNGRLDTALLHPCGLPGFVMEATAARAMRALVAAAREAGFTLTATGTYRTFEQQRRLFLSRYTRLPIPGRPTKTWKGLTYWQKPFTAQAATPGKSNHGLGLAADLAIVDKNKRVVSLPKNVVWFLVNEAPKFGIHAELQSEPWHWVYTAGDNIPEAVLAWETKS